MLVCGAGRLAQQQQAARVPVSCPLAPPHAFEPARLPSESLDAPPTDRPTVPQEDFMKAVRKLGESKKLEGHIGYSADFGDGGKS